jgi:serine/threonine protein kinase
LSSIHFLIGKTLGKYQVLEHIGHGGMSEVYKGQQTQLNRMVAIKVLHPFLADEEGFVVRFQREARIVATLRHPNIVQVFDFDYNEDLSLYYMIMEYIEGPTLKDRLAKGPVSAEQTARIGAAIGDALDYAHQRAMVHRDIKPANILFLNDTDPILTDFGIARMLDLTGLTASGAMVGTPAYMAPEVGRGKTGSAASDIYSLSVVLYEAVTGTLPFSAETPMGMVMEHLNSTPIPPSRVLDSIPKDLEEAILRGLRKEPEERFDRAGDMAAALRLALGIVNDRTPTPLPVPSTPEPLAITPDAQPAPEAPAIPAESPSNSGASVEVPSPSPPAPGPAAGEAQLPDEVDLAEGRLVKSWEAPVSVEAVLDRATPKATTSKPGRRPRTWLLGILITLLLASISGVLIRWRGAEISGPDGGSARLWGWLLAGNRVTPPASTVTLTPDSASETLATPATTATPPIAQGFALATHTPTPTPICTLRVRAEQVRIEPAGTVPPGTRLMAHISLENSGNCPWPAESALVRTSDDAMTVISSFSVADILPGESIQLFIPMTAPDETGSYRASWEMRQGDGRSFGSRVPIEIVVENRPALTPTPTLEIVIETPVPETITLEEPRLMTWQADAAKGVWSGVAQLQASGGAGSYRYFLGEISAATELPGGELRFEWRYCQGAPLNLWILSGASILNWRGEIPFPALEVCE